MAVLCLSAINDMLTLPRPVTVSILQVEAALNAELGSTFLQSNPEVAFHLQRCQFGQMVQDGHTEQALRLLRHSMAPIALQLQHLQPCLKVAPILSDCLCAFPKPA